MKKNRMILLTAAISISLFCFAGCSSSDVDSSDNSAVLTESEEKYFEITNLINDGDFDRAWTEMEELYGDTDYTGIEGFNKMNQYRLYYDTLGEYDEEIEVLFDYINENGYTENSDDGNYDYVVDCIGDIIDYVSDENKAIAADLTGIEVTVDTQEEEDSASDAGEETEAESAEENTGLTDTSDEDVVVASVADILSAYNANEFGADQQYKGKTVRVTGLVYDVNSTDDGGARVQLMPSGDDSSWDEVHCYFYDEAELQKVAGLTTGFDATIEGDCEGYDGFYCVEMSDCKVIG